MQFYNNCAIKQPPLPNSSLWIETFSKIIVRHQFSKLQQHKQFCNKESPIVSLAFGMALAITHKQLKPEYIRDLQSLSELVGGRV